MTGAEYKRGNCKDSQLNSFGKNGFHRYYDFEKVERGKYLIKEIFNKPLPIEDERKKGNNSVYSVFIELILMNYLSKKGKSFVETFMKKDLWKMLGMVNQKYGTITEEELININPLFTKFEIKNFFMRTNQKLERITRSALNNLKRRFLIEWEIQTIIHITVDNEEKWIVANDSQIKEILRIKRYVLEEFGMDNVFQVFSANKHKEYFKAVNDLLYQVNGWDYYFQRYKVIFDATNIRKAIPETEIQLNKALLNEKIIRYLNNDAVRNYNKNQENYQKRISETNCATVDSPRLPINYVVAQTLLADELLRIDTNINIPILEQSIDLEEEKNEIEQYFSSHFLNNENCTF